MLGGGPRSSGVVGGREMVGSSTRTDVLPTVVVRAGSHDPTRPLVPLTFPPFSLDFAGPVRRSVRRAHWHRRPCARCVRVRGVSGLVEGRLTHRVGFLGHDVRTVDVYVAAVVVVRLPVPSTPRLYSSPAPFVVVVSSCRRVSTRTWPSRRRW
jgi:hypothetical protein